MKVLALLLAVFLVRFCSTGRWSCFSGSKTNDIQVEQESQVTTTPITLDLTKPDESKVDILRASRNGVVCKEYYPKYAFHISSVVDSGATLWEASGDEKCVFVESYSKGALELLYLETSESSGTKYKYFEKTDGKWNEIIRELFNGKFMTMIGESGRDASLNIAHPSRLLCKSFDYTFTANRVKLIVPKKNTTVIRLVDGEKEIWIPSTGETFDHAKVYINKDGNPELALLVTTLSGTSKETYFELKDGKWVSCNDTDAKKKSLRDPADYISDFDLDLSLANSTDECRVFEAELLGVTTRHFYPKPGYHAKRVKNGDKELWKSAASQVSEKYASRVNAYGYYCLSCLVYKKGNKELLETVVLENSSRRWKYFEKTANGKWKSITKKKEFDKKLQEMRKS